jgi:hypothetical protein
MPDHDLDELEDNLWCHNHNHSHDDHVHTHESFSEMQDKYKSKKSILFNNTTVLVNMSHLKADCLKQTSTTVIECSECSFKIGYKKRKHSDYFFLWRSNILIDEKLKFDVFSSLELGRYIIELKNEHKSEKKSFIFVHVLTCNLRYKCLQLNSNDKTLQFDKKWKKLFYKIYNHDIELRNQWFNDINVEFISVSHFCYLKTLEKLVESTKSLPNSYRMVKNGFFIAIV